MHPVKGGEHAQKAYDNQNEEGHEERQRVYRPGPFALFYKLNEGKEDKDAEVWYYKHHKDIIGPVSSYNMDKMVYYKSVNDDTKVGYQSIDKFVKFKKIKSLVEAEQEQEENWIDIQRMSILITYQFFYSLKYGVKSENQFKMHINEW